MGDDKQLILSFLEQIKNVKNLLVIAEKEINSLSASIILSAVLKHFDIKFSLNFTNELNIDNNRNYLIINKNEIKTIFDGKEEKVNLNNDVCTNAYFIGKEASKENINLLYLALLFDKNKELIDEGINNRIIDVRKGCSIFGSVTRDIVKAIELSIEPYIISLSNNEKSVLEFLDANSISLKIKDKMKTVLDLDEIELDKMLKAMALRSPRISLLNPISDVYLIVKEEENSPLKDLNEFKLFLEGCIKLDRYSIAIGKCLNPRSYKNRAISLVKQYRQDTLEFLDLVNNNIGTGIISVNENLVVIKAEKKINEILIKLVYDNFFFNSEKALVSVYNSEILIYYKKYNSEYNINKLKEALKDVSLVDNGEILFLKFEEGKEKEVLENVLKLLERAKVEQVIG